MKINRLRDTLIFVLFATLLIMGSCFIIFSIKNIFDLASNFSFSLLGEFFIVMIAFSNYLIVLLKLLLLLESSGATPFTFDNVKRLKTMGYCLFINSIIECIMDYKLSLNAFIRIFGTHSGGITGPMIVSFLCALMCFVMSEIFDKAIRIKEEQDLTI